MSIFKTMHCNCFLTSSLASSLISLPTNHSNSRSPPDTFNCSISSYFPLIAFVRHSTPSSPMEHTTHHTHLHLPLSAHSTFRFCNSPIEIKEANMMMPVLMMGQPPIHNSSSTRGVLLSMIALQTEEKAVSLI